MQTQCKFHYCPLPCEECERQAHEASVNRERAKLLALQSSLIGKRYLHCTFDGYVPSTPESARVKDACLRYARSFPDRLSGGDNLLLIGNPGTGKNMLAACICTEAIGAGFSALHTTAYKLVRRIKNSWGSDESEVQASDIFIAPDLLVIDEIGVQFGSDTEKLLLFNVLNERYEDVKPTIVISNLSLDGMTEYLGERIIDRFWEGKSMLLEFNWSSWRRR